MGTFDFLSGTSAPNSNAQAYAPMQQYQQFANTGAPQGMDYSQVLGGGQASPVTQGLDFSKIGQWAINQNQYPGQQSGQDWQKILQDSYGATQATKPTGQPQLPQLQAARAGGPLGQVDQQRAGYIGGNTRLGLLGSTR